MVLLKVQLVRLPMRILALSLLLLGLRETRAHESNSLATVVNAWKARQARARSFDFVAVGTEFRGKENVSAAELARMGRPSAGGGITVPDTEFKVRIRLAVEGNARFRFEYDGKETGKDGYVDRQLINVFEGGIRRVVFPIGPSGFPNAHIQEETKATAPQAPQVRPVVMVYRPFDDEKIGVFQENKLTLTGNKAVLDGRPCLVMRHLEDMLWVDPAREFVPTRYHEVKRGVLMRSIEIKYASDAQHGWVPASWNNIRLLKNGNIRDSVTATVAEYKIGHALPNETFNVEYPPGSWVRDYIRDESYILREDGSQREVLKAEGGTASTTSQ